MSGGGEGLRGGLRRAVLRGTARRERLEAASSFLRAQGAEGGEEKGGSGRGARGATPFPFFPVPSLLSPFRPEPPGRD